jgi:ABC-type oligopeptide transport system substrate-binding subunit
LIAGSLLLGGCGDNSGAGAVSLARNQSVTFPIAHDLGNLDPAVAQGEAEVAVDGNLFDGVVSAANPGGSVHPDLASDLPDVSADGRTYTFHLRNGIHFSNGDPLTAGDLVYSWSRSAALHGPDASIFSNVAGYAATLTAGAQGKPMSGLTATDDHTLEVRLEAPQSYFLDRLASMAAVAVDRKVVAAPGDPLGRGSGWADRDATLVGTGPYHMIAKSAGASVDFAPVRDWWGDLKPVLHFVHLKVARDAADPVANYLSGGYDLVGYAGMEHFSPDAVTRLRQSAVAGDLTTVARNATTWIGFNSKLGPFAGTTSSAAKLRRAFSLAVDRRLLGEVVCHKSSTCIPATGGLVPPGMRGFAGYGSDNLAMFDATQASSLLKQADPDGAATRGLVIDVADTPENGALFQFLQEQWRTHLGVNVDRRTGHLQASTGAAPAPLFVQRWQAHFDDPRDLLAGYFASTGPANLGSFLDAKLDELIAKAENETSGDSLASYTSAARSLQADVAYIPAYYDSGNLLVRPRLVGASLGTFYDSPWGRLQVLQ